MLSLIVCLIGAVVHLFAVNPRPAELGRIMFWTGLFMLLWRDAAPLLH